MSSEKRSSRANGCDPVRKKCVNAGALDDVRLPTAALVTTRQLPTPAPAGVDADHRSKQTSQPLRSGTHEARQRGFARHLVARDVAASLELPRRVPRRKGCQRPVEQSRPAPPGICTCRPAFAVRQPQVIYTGGVTAAWAVSCDCAESAH